MSHAEPPPEARLMQTLFGFMPSRALSAVAELGVADALAAGPLYYTELARAVGADRRALHRAMRVLVSVGVFDEPSPGTFALSPVSEPLRSDVPGSMRKMAELLCADSHWLPWGRFAQTLRTGESGPQHAFGSDVFTWFERPENAGQWELFNQAMTSFSSSTAPVIAEAYDFSRFERIVDFGGGHGVLLRAILRRAPSAAGVLFDLPAVVAGVDDTVGGRLTCEGGSFFDGVPAGGDCYTMKHIIHDWSDEHCRALLGHVARAMRPGGTVLVCEMVMPESPEPHPAKFMDLNMLAMTEGGCERTEREFAALFESAGLRLVAIHPTPTPVSLVEATHV